jgi:selenocysteine lyase/cysteine desulfurase
VRRNYAPFEAKIDAAAGDFTYRPPADARRYQPGHVSYLGYAAVYEGLKFIAGRGGPTKLLEHSVRLNQYLLEQLDADEFRVLSTDLDSSPILTLAAQRFADLRTRLMASEVVVSIAGDKWDQLRISPAIYNTEADMDRLAEVLRG